MKIIKKYEYKLTEETLDKDIDKFIKEAKNGSYQMDHRYGQEGLKIIKAYFRIIKEEFKKGNFEISKECYKKMMFLLLQSEYNYFDYEDIVGRLNFKEYITNYFTCLIKLCTVEELFNEYMGYLKVKEDYYFEETEKTIMEGLDEKQFSQFKILLEQKAEGIKHDDYAMHDILTFLLDIAKKKEHNEERFIQLAMKFAPVLGYGDLKQFLKDYEDDR
ncbi:MAG: hypothetical protein ABH840_02720 [Nanoarchaeota archaeon]